ncbi:hypothetical protein N7517_011314 [Penicillium concentricum]|uniref:Uncharacterized protein n=1 Tax=Penicillium concentricum TaxID=293559 RepID=A0A9W9RAJ2_9EURO|nr:uncharacterized protein N7517_011314 [Penicillium concentricum]KAJ5356705.1 hypothetical protein N7517_011314 [Penicillium concentricum]
MSNDAHRWEQVAELYGGPAADLQITPQASVRCYVGQFLGTSWPLVTVNQWINENHIIWTLCAALAAHSRDDDWTRTFENNHRVQWDRIQATVEKAQGVDRFLLDIPPPPLLLAVFRSTSRSLRQNHAIMATPASVCSNGGLLDLLRFLYHGGFTSTDVFIVVLYDTEFTGFAPVSPPYAALGLPDPHVDVPVLHLSRPEEDVPTLPSPPPPPPPPPYRGITPPPPYRGPSPAPPGYSP